MDYKKIAYILLGIGIITILTLALINDDSEEYFNQVELSNNNTIVNSLGHLQYYDTILSVGMDAAGLNGITVVINDLTDAAKNQFNGELKAHLRLHNDIYYMFAGSLSRSEAINVISHEIIHMQQYQSGEMVYENEEVKWQGFDYTFALEDEYERRPWERDAFNKQGAIETSIRNILY